MWCCKVFVSIKAFLLTVNNQRVPISFLHRCSAVYHLPCALEASDVVLNRGVFELWCPDHVLSESDEEVPSPSKKGGRGRPPLNDDEDFSLQSVRPKRNAGTYFK